jgi:hypothetical protein
LWLVTVIFIAYHFLLRKETFLLPTGGFSLWINNSCSLPLVVFTSLVEPNPMPYDWSSPRKQMQRKIIPEDIFISL